MSRVGGGIIGPSNIPTKSIASGIWSINEVQKSKRDFIWPNFSQDAALRLDFDETTTLDSRITFTRATNGTYFDSSGVLRTAGSGVARFDHRLENGSWVNKGLLIEEQRTNLNIYSEEFNNAVWAKANITVTVDDETAPDGNVTADAIVENTTNAAHQVAYQTGTGITGNNKYTASVFLKKGTRDWGIVGLSNFSNFVGNPRAWFDLNNGVVGTLDTGADAATIQDCGNGWYRCTVTATTVASPPTATSGVTVGCSSGDNVVAYAGTNGAKALYAWGAQYELGAFPTSYIKTTTASVTRNADQASMTSTSFSDWYNATEGTVFIQNDFNGFNSGAGGNRYWEISNNTTNERLFLGTFAALSPANATRYAVIDDGSTQAIIDTSFAAVGGTTYKSIVVYKQNDFVLTVDGTQIGTDTSGTTPTVNRLDLGALFAASASLGYINGHIAKFYYWNIRKSDASLQNITS